VLLWQATWSPCAYYCAMVDPGAVSVQSPTRPDSHIPRMLGELRVGPGAQCRESGMASCCDRGSTSCASNMVFSEPGVVRCRHYSQVALPCSMETFTAGGTLAALAYCSGLLEVLDGAPLHLHSTTWFKLRSKGKRSGGGKVTGAGWLKNRWLGQMAALAGRMAAQEGAGEQDLRDFRQVDPPSSGLTTSVISPCATATCQDFAPCIAYYL
jgi:hypothetical protein